MLISSIPLSLYIHVPWCIQKCPYCDFNSHSQRGKLPEEKYIDQLILDLQSQLSFVQQRSLHSVYVGGGTPSLFSSAAYHQLFQKISEFIEIPNNIEITIEANPGTITLDQLESYRNIGINRLSLGIQSFQDEKLQSLGRIHNSEQAKNTILFAQQAGFENINIDIMFGLPHQTINDALLDLKTAVESSPTHLSWYQLTIEPNTHFYQFPPTLPNDDERFEIQQSGKKLLKKHGFLQYEISGYTKNNFPCHHNINYWSFGDYLGIGAGAHAKLTDANTQKIYRRENIKHPKYYLSGSQSQLGKLHVVSSDELPLEFMMNALRLYQAIPITLFESRTGLSFTAIEKSIQQAIQLDLLILNDQHIQLTEQGKLFLNDVLMLF